MMYRRFSTGDRVALGVKRGRVVDIELGSPSGQENRATWHALVSWDGEEGTKQVPETELSIPEDAAGSPDDKQTDAYTCGSRRVLVFDAHWPPCARCGIPGQSVEAGQRPVYTVNSGDRCK